MIFTQADRNKIFPALDRIEREVGKTASSQWAVAFATDLEGLKTILNQINGTLGRMEQRIGFHGETLDRFAVRLTKLEEFLQGNLGRALEQRASEDERVHKAIMAFIAEANEDNQRTRRKARRKKK